MGVSETEQRKTYISEVATVSEKRGKNTDELLIHFMGMDKSPSGMIE